jgi:hypothetical protein
MPVIVSLETSSVNRLSSRAAALHAVLHAKHASLVNTRFLDCAKTSFEYHRSVADGKEVLGGYNFFLCLYSLQMTIPRLFSYPRADSTPPLLVLARSR